MSSTINQIDPKDIEKLSAEELVKLLNKLVTLEIETNKINNIIDMLIPFNINTKDGGSDGEVIFEDTRIKKTKYFPSNYILFQCKATDLSPAELFEEILKPKKEKKEKRELKDRIKKLYDNQGTYILFTTKFYNQNLKESRIKKFKEAISQAGYKSENIQIYIYDGHEILRWVNEYIAVIRFIENLNGINRNPGFMILDEWEKITKYAENNYQKDETVKNNISSIRECIEKEKIIRIIGHSGLGKTHLVLEALKDVNLRNKVVYYSANGGENMSNIRDYIVSYQRIQIGIIVIDNCDAKYHEMISEILTIDGKLKIITIGRDVFDSSDTRIIKLNKDHQRNLVKQIVQEKLSETHEKQEIDHISKISEGYPWMAVKFCEKIKKSGIRKLNDMPLNDFIIKLLFGSKETNKEEYEVIRACSIFSSFGFFDNENRELLGEKTRELLNNQQEYIRTRVYDGKITETRFREICQKFYKEDIIEKRGMYYIVRPAILAIYLASQWIQYTNSNKVIEIIQELKNVQLTTEFVNRLRDLDQIDNARNIVAELWGPNCPFGTAKVLNTEWGSLLFRNIVDVNPIVATETLEEVFGNMTQKEILDFKHGRRNLIWALEKLCFRLETFNSNAKILYLFAVSENETWSNNSTNQFLQLFQVQLSGTEVPLLERLDIIKWGLDQNNEKYTELAIKALGRAIGDIWGRMGGAEYQGSSFPLKDYSTNNIEEIKKYWSEILELLTNLATSDDLFSELAKEQISKSVRVIINIGLISNLKKSIEKIINKNNKCWPEMINKLKTYLNNNRELPKSVNNVIETLINNLTPKSIKDQLFLKVINPADMYEINEDGQYLNIARKEAENFAKKLIEEDLPWKDYIVELLVGEQKETYNFSFKIAELIINKEEVINLAIEEFNKISKDHNLNFILGFLAGAEDKILYRKVIDNFIENDKLKKFTFNLTRSMNFSYEDVNKLFTLVDNVNCSIIQFKIFGYGMALDKLTPDEVKQLCEKLKNYNIDGKWVALDLIYMYCLNTEKRYEFYLSFLKELFLETEMLIENVNLDTMQAFHWTEFVQKILNNSIENDFAISITKQILSVCSQKDMRFSIEHDLKKICEILLNNYFDTVWKFFGKKINNDPLCFIRLRNILGQHNGNWDKEVGILFRRSENYDKIIKWCKKNKAVNMALLIPISIEINNKKSWHPFTIKFINSFGNDVKVLNAISSNMQSYGITGSVVPYYQEQNELLRKLEKHTLESVRNWSKNMIKKNNNLIKLEILREENRKVPN